MSDFRDCSKLSVAEVEIGQLWRRRNGIVYVVQDERGGLSRDVLLVPYYVPDGLKARKTWKWDRAVRSELVRVVVNERDELLDKQKNQDLKSSLIGKLESLQRWNVDHHVEGSDCPTACFTYEFKHGEYVLWEDVEAIIEQLKKDSLTS